METVNTKKGNKMSLVGLMMIVGLVASVYYGVFLKVLGGIAISIVLAVLIGNIIAKIIKKHAEEFETMQEALDNPIKWLPAAAYASFVVTIFKRKMGDDNFKEEMGDINDIIEEQEKKEK